ncbi:MAG: hypothetical protein AAFZ05_05875 [Pseudomonadota bacterium]
MLPIATALALAVSGCAQSGPTASQTEPGPQSQTVAPKRERPVVVGRPARVYIFAGFDEATCAPVATTVTITTPPQQGTVTFRANQPTTVTQSASGKCIGANITGTGVYYTARKSASGSDRFTVTATTQSGQSQAKSFDVAIAP